MAITIIFTKNNHNNAEAEVTQLVAGLQLSVSTGRV